MFEKHPFPIEESCSVCDETSMVDIYVARRILQAIKNGNQIIVKNPSAFYINFMFIKVNGQSIVMKDKNFVAPFSSASYSLPAGGGGKVEWKIINDMGGQSDLYQSSL